MGHARLFACALLGALLCAAPAHASVSDEIIVKRAPGLSAAERADLRTDAGVVLEEPLRVPRTELVVADDGERAEALAALNADPDVLWAEPNRVRRALTADPSFINLWGIQNTGQFVGSTADADVDGPEAWATSRGAGIDVAVVDSGVLSTHPDLRVLTGYDFVQNDADAQDGDGHGTHVAGTVAAIENGIGVVGVAPDAEILPVRVLGNDGTGTLADVVDGFDYAGDRGVRVVNASLGSGYESPTERAVIAAHPDTLFVVAAGNDAADNDDRATPTFPCNYDLDNIICVGASDWNDAPAVFSNYGATSVDLFAPGEYVYSTTYTSSYGYKSGTSMATPHVAGVAALLAAEYPAAEPAQLRDAILSGAEARPALTGSSVTGARLNAARALLEMDLTPPAAPAGVVASGDTRSVTLDWADSPEADLAEYRVRGVPSTGVFTTGASSLTLSSLADARTYTYEVSAVDAAGNESPRVTVSATTNPAPAAAPPPAVVVPPVAPSAPFIPASPTLTGARLSGRVVVCREPCRDRRGRLSFVLGANARVKLKLERKTCRGRRCSWSIKGRRGVSLMAGRNSLTVGSELAGLDLRPGSWRVTLATPQARARVPFRVYKR